MPILLGIDRPADLVTKQSTRTMIDVHLKFIGRRTESGRARAGLNIQGTANATADGTVDGTTTRIPKRSRKLGGPKYDFPT